MKRRIEDGRVRSFWWVENRAVDDLWIPFVGVHAWAIYCVLTRYADDAGRSFPSLRELSDLSGVSPAEVKRSLKVLLGSGLVRRVKKGGPVSSTVYQVRLPESKNEGAPGERGPRPARTNGSPRPPVSRPDPAKEFLDSLDTEEETPSPPPPAEKPTTKGGGKRKMRLPTAWAPNETHARIAEGEGVDIAREMMLFRDHAEATGRTMLDWDAAFRTWLRNARNFSREHYRQQQAPRSAKQKAADEVGEFYEKEEVV